VAVGQFDDDGLAAKGYRAQYRQRQPAG
jgi:hypothetical protein